MSEEAHHLRENKLRFRFIALGLALLIATLDPSIQAKPTFDVRRIAPGVFVHEGRIAPMSAANLGDTANMSFIVGDRCIAVIDTGGSPQVGSALEAAIKSHTDKPVCYVINTHAHPDHVFGNSAFLGQHRPSFVAHENFAAALGARMQTYLERFSRIYKQSLSADIVVPPDRVIGDTAMLDLGGRILKLTALPTGHTNNDLIVFDVRTGTLFAGDALFIRHVPVLDGSILGWLNVMNRLRDEDARRVVPGHGPASAPWPRSLDAQRAYLETIVAGIRRIIDRDGMIQDAIDTVGYSARDQWLLFDEYHRRNVTAAFAELEWE